MAGLLTLFRAVSDDEYADIAREGAFTAAPSSFAEGKFFAETGEDAVRWGEALDGAGRFRVVMAEFPEEAANRFMRWARLDGIGPARFARFDQIGRPVIMDWSGSS